MITMLIGEELNVKKVRLLDAAAEAVDYQLNPLPRQLGSKYAARFPAVRKAIAAFCKKFPLYSGRLRAK